jgi:hypothetical protein
MIDDGKIQDPAFADVSVTEDERLRNLKKIKEYNAEWKLRNHLDRAVQQTIISKFNFSKNL